MAFPFDTRSASPAAEQDSFQQQFARTTADATEVVEGLTDEQFNWRPGPGRWSVGECLVHLNLTSRAYLPVIDQAIARARSRGLAGSGSFRFGFLNGWLIRTIEPPPRRKFKTPKPVAVAPAGHEVDAVLREFVEYQDKLLACTQRAEGIDLARAKLRSPLMKLLKLSLAECFALLAAHERRHLWQARQVVAAPGFPRN